MQGTNAAELHSITYRYHTDKLRKLQTALEIYSKISKSLKPLSFVEPQYRSLK